MAKRAEIAERKRALLNELRSLHGSGRLRAGAPVPPVRELGKKFNLSTRIVSQELEILVAEGILNKVPNVGTFFGRPRNDAFEFFLFVIPLGRREGDETLAFLQFGFEDRIAHLGGMPLTMPLDKVTEHAAKGELPQLAGVFEPFPFSRHLSQAPQWSAPRATPLICFEHSYPQDRPVDEVSFDDINGGRQATQHLLDQGYHRIAFLGMHTEQSHAGEEFWEWSRQREAGWRSALRDAGLWDSQDSESLAFRRVVPELLPADSQALLEAAFASAAPLIERLARRGDIEAVVAASDMTAMGLLNALRAAGVPHTRWPAIIGFDNLPLASGHVLSSLRLPWEEIGRAAAELLWDRWHDRLDEAPQQRRVAMRLIPRLTCRNEWPLEAHHSALTTVAAPDPLRETVPMR